MRRFYLIPAILLLASSFADAETLTGVAVDDLGDRIAKAQLHFVNENGDAATEHAATTDAHGRFSVDGLEAGENRVYCGGEWEVIQPGKIDVPSLDPVRVLLRHMQVFPASGRVVSKQGKPVAGAQVTLVTEMGEPPGAIPGVRLNAVTGNDGRFVFTGIRPAGVIELEVRKEGWRILSRGIVSFRGTTLSAPESTDIASVATPIGASHPNPDFNISDTVLEALNGKVAGRVLTADGKPAAGARVVVAEGTTGTEVAADGKGAFSLGGFPEGKITVIAVHSDGFATLATISGSTATVLKLTAYRPSRPYDESAARTLLHDLYKREIAADPKLQERLPDWVAYFDTDLALEILGKGQGPWEISQMLDMMTFNDPPRAAKLGPPLLDKLPDSQEKRLTAMLLAVSVADILPDFTRAAMKKEKDAPALAATNGDARNSMTFILRALYAACAMKLNDPDGPKLFDDAVAEAQAADLKAEHNFAESDMQVLVLISGLVHLNTLERTVDLLPPGTRTMALSQLAMMSDIRDPRLALRLLTLIDTDTDAPNGGPFGAKAVQYAMAADSLIRSIGPTDPATALAIARKVKAPENATALALAAQFQPKDAALALLREAIATARDTADPQPGQPFVAEMPAARMAAMAFDIDPAAGKELFAIARARLLADAKDQTAPGALGMVQFAYYYARLDPLESRQLLELELARLSKSVQQRGPWPDTSRLQIAQAMAAINVDRALEIAKASTDTNNRFAIEATIAGYLMVPANIRHTMPLQTSAWSPDEHKSLLRGQW